MQSARSKRVPIYCDPAGINYRAWRDLAISESQLVLFAAPPVQILQGPGGVQCKSYQPPRHNQDMLCPVLQLVGAAPLDRISAAIRGLAFQELQQLIDLDILLWGPVLVTNLIWMHCPNLLVWRVRVVYRAHAVEAHRLLARREGLKAHAA